MASTMTPTLGKRRSQATGAGRPDELFRKQQGATFEEIPIERVEIIDKFLVRVAKEPGKQFIKESLREKGVSVPIIVKETNTTFPRTYRLVAGQYRTLGWRELYEEAKLAYEEALERSADDDSDELKNELETARVELDRWANIPAIVYPKSTPDEVCKLEALSENYHRVALTKEEKAQADGDYGEALVKLGLQKSVNYTKQKKSVSYTNRLFSEWYNKAGIQKKTAFNHWRKYMDATGRAYKTPAKSDDNELRQFFVWYKAEAKKKQKKLDQEVARQQLEGEIEARAQRRKDLKEAIQALCDEDGVEFCRCLLADCVPQWVSMPKNYDEVMEKYPLEMPPEEEDEDN